MSKRGADEYITKEHGSIPNTASEAQKVKMATAAQLAKRKMAVPKSRAGRSGQSPMPGAGPSNPFASTTSFGASQNNQQPSFPSTGGIAFGASQSFPSGDTANGGFNFSVPGQSTSFTFGQTTSNNPFTSLNGNPNGQPALSPDTDDITMESPQKKPAFGSNIFGANNIANNTQSTGFAFGQSTSQPPTQPSFSFGQSQGFGNGPTTSLFGQTTAKAPELNSTAPTFGQPAQSPNNTSPTPPPFSQASTPPEQQVQSADFNFGQSTTAPAASSAPSFSFAQSTTSAPSAAPTFSFGQSSTQPPSSSTIFGQSSQDSLPAFGSLTSTSQPPSSAPLFGSSSNSLSNNTFGGFSGSKSAEPIPPLGSFSKPEQPRPSLFGQSGSSSSQEETKPSSTTQEQPKSNPFAGLFGQNTPKQPQAAAASTPEPSKPAFSFSAPAQPSGLFSPKPAEKVNDSKAPEETTKAPVFSFGTPATQPSSGLSSAKSATENSAGPSNPFAGLSAKTQELAEKKPENPSLGQKTSTQPITESSTPGVNGFGGLGKSQNFSSATTPKPLFSEQYSQAPTQQPTFTFGSATTPTATESSKPSTDVLNATAAAAAMAAGTPNAVSFSGGGHDSATNPKRTVNTYPPTRIPPYLNGDDYKAYDSNYRLHSLNREFQKRIASLDPSRDDFENIIRNYIAARESIGESIGLHARSVAGMKRKADEEDDRSVSETNSAKRNRPADQPQPKQLFGASPTPSSIFQPVPSTTPKPSSTSIAAPANKNASPSKQNASSLFNSMIPDNKSSSPAPVPSNVFGNLPNSNTSGMHETTGKPVFSFGKSTTSATAGSTTPTKSPPKKPTFEVPSFSAPAGGNFMDAFKKQSDESAAKFAKEAKAKRKAEEFDSDEDDEEEWERKYEEEEKAKKATVDAIAQKGFKPIFANGTTSSDKPLFGFGQTTNPSSTVSKPAPGFSFGNHGSSKSSNNPVSVSDNDASGEDDEEEDGASGESQNESEEVDDEEEEEADEDDLPEDDVQVGDDNDEDEDLETAMANSRNKGRSLFDRVTPNPTLQKNSSPTSATTTSTDKETAKKPNVFAGLFGKGTPETPSFSPLTPMGSKEPYVPSKTFNFTPTPPITSPAPVAGASIFAGGMIKDGPISGEGLFGSRPSTPSNMEKPKTNFFGGFGTPSANSSHDHTWKKGSEIKFGTSANEAPSLNITEPSPRKDEFKPFANLFGANLASINDSSSQPNFGFGFGQTPVPGFLAAASHLAGGSGTNSGMSSRATSPGTTDNESVATNEEDFSNDAQVSLLESRPGEENENVIFETRARALRWYKEDEIQGTKFNKGWNAVGLGNVRLLKHKETGKARVVMRADPGANIILNTNLLPEVRYEYAAAGNAGTVKFTVFTDEGGQGWTLKTKTQQQAQEMAKFMEENKKPNN